MPPSEQDTTRSALSRALTPVAFAAVVVLFAGLMWNAQQKAPSGGEIHIVQTTVPPETPSINPPTRQR
jgi:hypothetical protein